jgi:glucokinase
MVSPLALGLDLGGTHTRAAVVDRSTGKVVTSVKDTHADKTPEGVVASMAKVAAAAAKQAGVTEPLPCGVGAAAQLNGDVITLAPNLGWRNIPFGALLGKAFGRRVTVVNDLKAAAWGEFTAGVAKGETDAYTLFVGSGVGSAIISGGRMVLGNTGLAGEVGHLKIVFEGGRKCGCGELGCLEAYVGGVSMEGWMKESGLKGGAMELEIAAHAGDPAAMKLWDFASASLALVVANQVTVLNPGCVVLGGGVLMRCPMMVQRIEKTVAARALASSRVGLKVGLAALGDDAGVVGAAMLALDA